MTLYCKKPKSNFVISESAKELKLIEAFPNLKFVRPIGFQVSNDGSKRVFVTEQEGLITVFENQMKVGQKQTFLDISERVDDKDNEEGLLGIAFHPNYKENGYLYANYTVSCSETHISRFSVDANNPNKANPDSELILLKYDQPYGNHNGGQLAFGPDGYLYISVGDGGSGGDPKLNGQNPKTLLGSILRIDVNKSSNGNNYGIPADNPFAAHASNKKEIYAYGLRNPWRISFDSKTGTLWCADVGQDAYEEIDIIKNGGNYGWNEMEGLHTFKSGKDSDSFIAPVLEIPQSSGDKSITGGYVYRGSSLPSLIGKYIFADYVSGRIYALSHNSDGSYSNKTILDSDLNIASFGIDSRNELYICAFDGKIYQLQE